MATESSVSVFSGFFEIISIVVRMKATYFQALSRSAKTIHFPVNFFDMVSDSRSADFQNQGVTRFDLPRKFALRICEEFKRVEVPLKN